MLKYKPSFNTTKRTCFYTYLATSTIFSLPPLLFVTFREMYGISYTLLGTLVLINFCVQLVVDLIFTFFSKRFNIKNTIKIMPLITSLGLLVYAIIPFAFPSYAYLGLAIGTVIFSIAAGLCEVLLSPLVAALPSDNPERDMSKLHSLYAYGVLTVVVISTLFLNVFGRENWMYLTLFWAVLPIGSYVFFSISPIPELNLTSNSVKTKTRASYTGLAMFVICIFLGSASENLMTNWISGYMENALQIPKVAGDIVGMATFAVLLGAGRTVYAKYGKNISKILLLSFVGATVCYLVVGVTTSPVLSIVFCVAVGLCTAMLWPGSLIYMEEQFPAIGVTAYALMAAGGDLGGSVAPQMMGAIVDTVSQSDFAIKLSNTISLTPEQIGMKTGMLIATVFPLFGVVTVLYMRKRLKKR